MSFPTVDNQKPVRDQVLDRGQVLARLEQVSKTYRQGERRATALESVTCTIRAGDHIALVGASGSGKSTLLHITAGLETPTEGEVSWPGLGTRESLRPAKVGLVFQMPSLVPSLSVIENVEIPLLLQGVSGDSARQAAEGILEALEIDTLADKQPDELSGGQAQRVGLARALVHDPPLILADEPTGQLDHQTSSRMLDLLLAHLRRTGSALVVATHDLAVAAQMPHEWQMSFGKLKVGS